MQKYLSEQLPGGEDAFHDQVQGGEDCRGVSHGDYFPVNKVLPDVKKKTL